MTTTKNYSLKPSTVFVRRRLPRQDISILTIHSYLSPAKVNLFLRILKKREDGYHDILTVMQPVSLYDEILLEAGDGRGIFIEFDKESVPSDETHLVYSAAHACF